MIRKLTQKKKKRDEQADEFIFEVPQNHSNPQKPARSLPTNTKLPTFKDIYEEPLYITPQKK